MQNAVRASLLGYRMEAVGLDAAAAQELTNLRVRVATERITERGRAGSGMASMMFGFAIAFLLYMTIVFYGQAILRGVLEEKTTRVAEVIVSSVKPDYLLAGKVNFLLDATLGLINLEQNQIIKIFTVASVVFLPPTLVASAYGMNFELMPELQWTFGYPYAIGLMIFSALMPFLYFKRRGWV